MAERVMEQLKVEIEVFRIAALTTVSVGAGTVGLFLGEQTTLRLLFAAAGVLVTGSAIFILWRRYRAMRSAIATIGEQS